MADFSGIFKKVGLPDTEHAKDVGRVTCWLEWTFELKNENGIFNWVGKDDLISRINNKWIEN